MSPLTALKNKTSSVDWVLFGAALILAIFGLLTMGSFTGQDQYVVRQSVWIVISVIAFFVASSIDWRFLRRTGVATSLYVLLIVPLVLLLVVGVSIKGAKSWVSIGSLGIEPVEFAKLALIIVLAKYFSRRHIEIRNVRHILLSGLYAGVVFVLVTLQPDFGGAIIIMLIWLGMVLFSGISRKHLVMVLLLGLSLVGALWLFGFQDYQKQRILTFINPHSDIQGAGYNVYQSTIAVGSGQLLGKGIGYGTQSKLQFLPEYQTDFIFAAFAEEWGFLGVLMVLVLYASIFVRLESAALRGATNFETLFTMGVLCYLFAHVALHAGINMGILPVTGTTIPFMSYGGSHLLAEFVALGIVSGQRRYARATDRGALNRELSGGYDLPTGASGR